MKHTWLYLALCAWITCASEAYAWIIVLPCMIFLYHRQGSWCLVSFVLLGMLCLNVNPKEQDILPEQFEVDIIEMKSTYAIAQTNTSQVVLYGIEAYGLDDQLQVTASCDALAGNRNFFQFDFAAYMQKRGIVYGCQVKEAVLLKEGTSLRAHLWNRIQAREEQERAWLKLSLFGVRENDSEDDEARIEEEQELSYLASSSGMHISLLSQGLMSFLLLWMSPQVAGICACMMMLGIGTITSFRDSLFRVICFRFVSTLFPSMTPHDRLGIGMIIVLLCRPYLAGELTFVLPVMFRLLYVFQVHKKTRWLMSYLVLIPIQFHYFNEVDMIQILLFPLLRWLYAGTYCLALITLLVPLALWYVMASCLFTVAMWFDRFCLPLYFHASVPFVLLWYMLCFRYISRNRSRDAYLLLVMLFYTQVSPYLRPYMEVMMIDVGQGDCTLISLPFHQGNILIDVAGHKKRDLAKDIIVPVLHAKGITSLDLVIITHDDFDHSGGLAQLQKMMEVKKVVQHKQEDIMFGSFRFQFLLQDHRFEDANENSILTYLEAYDTKLLFMGDAGKPVEQALLKKYPNLRADILKVGHHGSKSSSSSAFVHQLHPTLALISCGRNNFYGHPSPETLATLTKEEITYFDTPTYGAISIKFTNILRFYKTATNEFGIIELGDYE